MFLGVGGDKNPNGTVFKRQQLRFPLKTVEE